jgi:HD-GYP domain-containing protein (c-di-GMP phosphodiesterase class II)
MDIPSLSLSLKSLTFYGSMVLYAIALVYALVLASQHLAQNREAGGTAPVKKRHGLMSMDEVLELSQQIDAYERMSGDYNAQAMAEIAIQIGEQYGLPPEELESLRVACLLHDVGEFERYDFIQEDRMLRPDEWVLLEDHPLHGYRFILENLGEEHANAAKWVRWSHERWDGTGYPDRLVGEQIPLSARILTVADAYCALSSDRPHRPALSPERVIEELQRYAGIYFDPQIVQMLSVPEEASASALEI